MRPDTPRTSEDAARGLTETKFNVRPGDIFRDKDPRSDDRHLKVIAVEGLKARLVNCTPEGRELPGRNTRVSLHGLETRFVKVGGSRQRVDLERAVLRAAEGYVEAMRRYEAETIADESGQLVCGTGMFVADRFTALCAAVDELLKP